MKFTLYIHFASLTDFRNGETVQCRPTPHSDHDVLLTVDLDKVNILTNQTGIYIERKTFKKWLKKVFHIKG